MHDVAQDSLQFRFQIDTDALCSGYAGELIDYTILI